MKKFLFYLQATIVLVLAFYITLSGCSKDKMLAEPANTQEITVSNPNTEKVANWGSVTGRIIMPPKCEIKMVLYSRDFYSEVFYYTKDGGFRFDKVPPGVYSIAIHVYNAVQSFEHEVPKVVVKRGVVTDIGKVIIQ